jgi:type 1 glutamine amidotransferase
VTRSRKARRRNSTGGKAATLGRRPRKSGRVKRIVFQTGGPWHPVHRQAALIQSWLPAEWRIETAQGNEALDRLEEADLYVAGAFVGPELNEGIQSEGWKLAEIPAHGYTTPTEAQKESLRCFVGAGRPVLAFHGGIVAYGDWKEYGRLLGFRWERNYTGHARYQEAAVTVATDSHPTVTGVSNYVVSDEIYYNVIVPPEATVTVHAHVAFADWVSFPMVATIEGPAGRCDGAGRSAFLANGHTMESLQPPAIRHIWVNTLRWLLGEG